MKPTIWHAMVGIALIAASFSIVGTVAYMLYGPGFTVTVPDIFGFNRATSTENASTPDYLAGEAGTRYECAGQKALKAEFLEGSVRLALSDGRRVSLPQTIAASGTRYANTDESFVFHAKNDGSFIEETGVMTYGGCVATAQ